MKDKQKFAETAKKIVGLDGWNKLRKAMFETEVIDEEKVKEEMAEATLADGTIIEYDKLEEGGMVMVIAESGPIQAPDGSHELTDGTVVETQGGVITSISTKVAEEMSDDLPSTEVVHDETKVAIDMESITKMMDEKTAALYEKIKAMLEPEKEEMAEEEEEEIEEVKEEMRAMREGFAVVMEIIENMMESQPTSAPTEIKPQGFNFAKQNKENFKNAQDILARKRQEMTEKNAKGELNKRPTK